MRSKQKLPDLKNWVHRHEAIRFGEPSDAFEHSWYPLFPREYAPKDNCLQWPYLIVFFAYPRPSGFNPAIKNLWRDSKYVKRFHQFYRGVDETFLLGTNFVLAPTQVTVTPQNSKALAPWRLVTTEFWTSLGIYPSTMERGLLIQEMQNIVLGLWEVLKMLDSDSKIEKHPFHTSIMERLENLSEDLIDDTNNILEHHWIKSIPVDEDCHYYAIDPTRWRAVPKNQTKEQICALRTLDARDALNDLLRGTARSGTEQVVHDFWKSFGTELIARKRLIQCQHCHSYALYWRGKKYCSKSKDGRDCLKRAMDAKDYKLHRATRLKKRRGWMKKTRQEIPGY